MTGKFKNSPYYKKKFAKQLREGMRRDGKTIEHCCREWGISRATYNNWKKDYPEFAKATEIGEQDFYIYWYELGLKACNGEVRVNAGIYNYVMTNLHQWQTKTETKQTHDEQIQTININVIEGRKPLVIEHDTVEPDGQD